MKVHALAVGILTTLFLLSCESDSKDYEILQMKDGKTIKYSGKTEYLTDAMKPVPINYPPEKYQDATDSVFGYDECDTIQHFYKAKIGDWGQKYGLSSEKFYYVRNEIYFQTIPCRSNERVYDYNPENSHCGLLTNGYIDQKIIEIEQPLQEGITTNTSNIRGNIKFLTGLLHIAYDDNGNKVNVYYPCSPQQLQWYFYRVTRKK